MKSFLLNTAFAIIALLSIKVTPGFCDLFVGQRVNTAAQNYGDNGDPTQGVIFDGDYTLSTTADGQNFGEHWATSIQPAGANSGTLNIFGNTNLTNKITYIFDLTYHLKLLNANGVAGKTLSLGGDSYVTTMNFGGDGNITIADGSNFYGNVTTSANNQGKLISLGNNTFNEGGIGTNSNRLKEVRGAANGKTTSFANDVYAVTTSLIGNGTMAFNGSLTGTTLNFEGDGTATVANSKSLTAAVTTGTNATGTLTSLGTSTFTGQVGTASNQLKEVRGAESGKTTTFANDVYAVTGTINNTGTMAFNGNFAGATLNFARDGIAQIANSRSLTAAVTTSTNNTGTLTLSGASTITGQVGTSTRWLKELKAGASGSSTIANDVFATTNTITGTGTAAFNGNITGTSLNFAADGTAQIAANKNINAAVTVTGNNQGTLTLLGSSIISGGIGTSGHALTALNYNGGTHTLGNNVFSKTTTLNNAATVSLSANRAITGDLTLAGTSTLDLGTNTLTLGGTGIYTQGSGTTLKLSINDASAFGTISASGNAVVNAASVVNVAVNGYVPNSATFKILDGTGGADVNAPATVNSNSPLVTFSASSSNGDVILTANRANTYTSVTGNGNAGAAGAVLESIGIQGATGDMRTVLNTLEMLPNTGAIANALNTLLPPADGGATSTTTAALTQFIETTITRIENVLTAAFNPHGATGVSTGDVNKGNENVWGQGFGTYAHQSPRGTSNGYNAVVWGTAVGADMPVYDDFTRAGASFGFAESGVNSKDNSAKTDINSYQLTLYGGHQGQQKPYFLDGALSFAYNDYTGSRHIAIGAMERTADAAYAGQQYSAIIGGGYTLSIGAFAFTPLTSLQYMHLRLNSYTETGADALNLHVDRQQFDLLQSGLGFKMEYPLKLKNNTFIPEVHFKWLYDFIGDKQETTSTFSGGGAAFKTSGFAPARASYDVGTKMTFVHHKNFDLSFTYDYQFKKNYYSHTGMLRAKLAF